MRGVEGHEIAMGVVKINQLLVREHISLTFIFSPCYKIYSMGKSRQFKTQ